MTTDQTIAQMLQTLQSLATEYAPAAFQTALSLKQIDGVQMIAAGLGLLIAALLLRPRRPKGPRLTPEQITRRDMLAGKGYAGRSVSEDSELQRLERKIDWLETPIPMFQAMGAAGCAIGAACILFDIWNWVAVFNPTLALAHDLLVKVMQ